MAFDRIPSSVTRNAPAFGFPSPAVAGIMDRMSGAGAVIVGGGLTGLSRTIEFEVVTTTLIWAHLAATLYLTGLIWVIQVVHYPLMDRVPGDGFIAFHTEHARRIGVVVIVPMLVELITALALLVIRPPGVPVALLVAGVVLVGAAWLSTFALQVPLHRRLSEGFDPAAHRALVRGNWIRTAAWTLRAAVAIAVAVTATGA